MVTWEVVTVFTAGHCSVQNVNNEADATVLAKEIARYGHVDVERRTITPTSQIGAIYWHLTTEQETK